MRLYRQLLLRIVLCIICLVLTSCCLVLIPAALSLPEGQAGQVQYLLGAFFWVSLATALICLRSASGMLKRNEGKLSDMGVRETQTLPGIISFSGKPGHILIYTAVVAGLIISVLDAVLKIVPAGIMFMIYAGTLAAIAVHAVIDGRIYKTIRSFGKSLEEGKNGTDK